MCVKPTCILVSKRMNFRSWTIEIFQSTNRLLACLQIKKTKRIPSGLAFVKLYSCLMERIVFTILCTRLISSSRLASFQRSYRCIYMKKYTCNRPKALISLITQTTIPASLPSFNNTHERIVCVEVTVQTIKAVAHLLFTRKTCFTQPRETRQRVKPLVR